MTESEFIAKISEIQSKLKAPKNQKNSFGNYKYRSCEDILESVKPLLKGLVLKITDEIFMLGDRFYVKATTLITDGEHTIENSAYAREPITKKGMDEAQVTGATSSYARKYALNGLLCIDDTKDADYSPNGSKQELTKEETKILDEWIVASANHKGITVKEVEKEVLELLKIDSFDSITKQDYNRAISALKAGIKK